MSTANGANGDNEREPLLASSGIPPPPRTHPDLNDDDSAIERATARTTQPEFRRGDTLTAFMVVVSITTSPLQLRVTDCAQGPLLVLALFTWLLVFTSNPSALGFFAVHPPAQTLAVLLFSWGILTLQPTRSATSKKAGLARHQLIQLGLAVPVLLVGTAFMWWNKHVHGAAHFTTWHGVRSCLDSFLYRAHMTYAEIRSDRHILDRHPRPRWDCRRMVQRPSRRRRE